MSATNRMYSVGYINGSGKISTFGGENSWLPAVEDVVAQVSRDDPDNEFFVAYRDIPAWERYMAENDPPSNGEAL